MSKHTYELITRIILDKLAQGHIPWRRPWSGAMPQNIRGNEYRGANHVLLGMSDFKSPFWLTYKQATERGGHVKKGEKSSTAIFWKLTKIVELDNNGELQQKSVPFMRTYGVFNLEQTENVKLEPKLQQVIDQMESDTATFDPIAKADGIWGNFKNPPALVHGATGAFYRTSTDTIHLPHRCTFQDAPSYYGTLFHEAGHSTAHESRLSRKLGNRFGSKDYALEELTAELASAFLLAKAGLDPVPLADQQAAYIQSWSRKLKDDPKLFVTAAGKAQKAADFILGVTATSKEPEAAKELCA